MFSIISDVLLAVAVSFDEIALKSEVKLVDFNAMDPKTSSDVMFFVFCSVLDVVEVEDVVDIVEAAGDGVTKVVEFSFSSMVVFFNSLILFISGRILIVAENLFIAFKQFRTYFISYLLYRLAHRHRKSNFLQ